MIPPSSTTEVSVDSVEKNEVESTEQPPSPASTTSQESKVLRERDGFFSPPLSLFWKEMYCFDFYLEPCARISGRVLWATSVCSACSDTPASEFSLSPQESELGKYLPFEMFGFVDFCLCFLLRITVTSWGSDGAQGGGHCQWTLLPIFTPSIRSLKGLLLEKLIFLQGSEKIILSGGSGYFTWLSFTGRLISELPLFNESVKTGYKWQFCHNEPYVHHPEKDFCFHSLFSVCEFFNGAQFTLLKINFQLKWHGLWIFNLLPYEKFFLTASMLLGRQRGKK